MRRAKPLAGLPPSLADLNGDRLLTREQEVHLFRKMNFLKHQAARLLAAINPAEARTANLDLVEALQGEALSIRTRIIRANLRLVGSLVKRIIQPNQDFAELASDGYVSLIQAIEKFDFSRGNKFSTYAWQTIMNNSLLNSRRNHQRERLVPCQRATLNAAPDHRNEGRLRDAEHELRRDALLGILGRLNDRERTIIVSRFGLEGAREKTLGQIGKELGISKERVRQIEVRARVKLRRYAEARTRDLLTC